MNEHMSIYHSYECKKYVCDSIKILNFEKGRKYDFHY